MPCRKWRSLMLLALLSAYVCNEQLVILAYAMQNAGPSGVADALLKDLLF